eukprot:1183164-Amorphochlora_amoeboformis.AAC.1
MLIPSSYLTKAQSDGLENARRNLGQLLPVSSLAAEDNTARDFKSPSNAALGAESEGGGRYGSTGDFEEKS